jgi:hypothetical protein
VGILEIGEQRPTWKTTIVRQCGREEPCPFLVLPSLFPSPRIQILSYRSTSNFWRKEIKGQGHQSQEVDMAECMFLPERQKWHVISTLSFSINSYSVYAIYKLAILTCLNQGLGLERSLSTGDCSRLETALDWRLLSLHAALMHISRLLSLHAVWHAALLHDDLSLILASYGPLLGGRPRLHWPWALALLHWPWALSSRLITLVALALSLELSLAISSLYHSSIYDKYRSWGECPRSRDRPLA